jgi:hypothetical protein
MWEKSLKLHKKLLNHPTENTTERASASQNYEAKKNCRELQGLRKSQHKKRGAIKAKEEAKKFLKTV